MHHSFYFSSHLLLLFKEWQIDSSGLLVAAFAGLFVFTLLYEVAASFHSRCFEGRNFTWTDDAAHRERRENEASGNSTISYGSCDVGSSGLRPSRHDGQSSESFDVRLKISWIRGYILRSLSFPVLVASNYFIMLTVMSYNAWMLIAVCLASGLAYYTLRHDADEPEVKRYTNDPTTPLSQDWARIPSGRQFMESYS